MSQYAVTTLCFPDHWEYHSHNNFIPRAGETYWQGRDAYRVVRVEWHRYDPLSSSAQINCHVILEKESAMPDLPEVGPIAKYLSLMLVMTCKLCNAWSSTQYVKIDALNAANKEAAKHLREHHPDMVDQILADLNP